MDEKLKEASTYFEMDYDEVDKQDYNFRADLELEEGDRIDSQDLDLRRIAVRKPVKREQFQVTTEEALRKADFRNVEFLAQFQTEAGGIVPRSKTGISAKAHRKIAREIKTARAFGLMPFTTMGREPFVFRKSTENLAENYEYQNYDAPRAYDENVSPKSINSTSSECRSNQDDDHVMCNHEDVSRPACSTQSSLHVKKATTTEHPLYSDRVSGQKAIDERPFRVPMEDLTMPIPEACLPHGLMTVSLKKYQRIALFWMSQRETTKEPCSGGILADDMGLGKTISTIALILKERPPLEHRGSLLSAGTLVVCPKSVMRQWAEEFKNKVTAEANISVLEYCRSNRTKDPFDLAKYDVVLTTYPVVKKEFPKKPSIDEDGDEKRGDVSGPLAKVKWFRVILDEAQYIKDHKTQVARACWGLRAKRRWCLSGTPLQNSVNDFYSYFRFLRHNTLSSYKSFRSTIKVPITKNPSKGYMNLQANLKPIMLRRLKGTLIDGKPIITLPPKVVLRKVDFTEEERDFYTIFEDTVRAEFNDYVATEAVKQNYMHILSKITFLRRACHHPLLVQNYKSKSKQPGVNSSCSKDVKSICPLSIYKVFDWKSYDSSKIKAALDYLKSLMGEKALVFSQWTDMLDLLEVALKRSSIQYRRRDLTNVSLCQSQICERF